MEARGRQRQHHDVHRGLDARHQRVAPNLRHRHRVQPSRILSRAGVTKPSDESDIRFEVWLPQPAGWNHKFLSTADTGHVSTDQWWGIGHPEKVVDYLYRAKHVTTVAAKAIIAAYYGQAPSHSYFSACSNGGRQGLIEAQRYPDDFDGLIIGAPWNVQSHSNAGLIWNTQAFAAPGAAIPAEKLPAITSAGSRGVGGSRFQPSER